MRRKLYSIEDVVFDYRNLLHTISEILSQFIAFRKCLDLGKILSR